MMSKLGFFYVRISFAFIIALSVVGISQADILPFSTSETRWSVDGSKIYVQTFVDGVAQGGKKLYVARGIDYSPVPINDSDSAGGPLLDYFYSPGNKDTLNTHLTYRPIWERDVGGSGTLNSSGQPLEDGFLRQMGVNNIRLYAVWHVKAAREGEPDEFGRPRSFNYAQIVDQLNWDPVDPVIYENNQPAKLPANWKFDLPGNDEQPPLPNGAYPPQYHNGHDVFLNMAWNNGDQPIYVILGLALPPGLPWPWSNASTDGNNWENHQEFYLKSAEWLARTYGNHPAVMGFCLGNEVEGANKGRKEFWDFLTQLNDTVKTYAPNKLTMAAFHNDPEIINGQAQLIRYVTPPRVAQPLPGTEDLYVDATGQITNDPGVGVRRATPVDVYGLDIWGWNAYNTLTAPGNLIPLLKQYVMPEHPKPSILTEYGAPKAKRYNTTWVPPDNPKHKDLGGEGDAVKEVADQAAREGLADAVPGLVVKQKDDGSFWLYNNYNAPWIEIDATYSPFLDQWLHGGYKTAGAALLTLDMMTVADQFNPVNASGNDAVLSGYQLFSFVDEWWKLEYIDNGEHLSKPWRQEFTQATATQFGDPNGLHFTTGWEEEWWGVMAAAPTGRQASDPVVSEYGWLNGGPDTLTPRAPFHAIQNHFNDQASHVSASSPAAGGWRVPVNTDVNVEFDQIMDASTINNTNLSLAASGAAADTRLDAVAASVTYDAATNVATITPTGNLAPQTTYTVTVSGEVATTSGSPMSGDQSWTFSTGDGSDSDGDGVEDNQDEDDDNQALATPNTVDGEGKWYVRVSSALESNLTDVHSVDDLNSRINHTGLPENAQLLHGLIAFTLTGLTPGQSVQVNLGLSEGFPDDAVYFMLDENGFHKLDNVELEGGELILNLVDGGIGDPDGQADGEIRHIGGPSVINAQAGSGGGGSSSGCFIESLLD